MKSLDETFFCPAGLEKGPAGKQTYAGCTAGLGKRFGYSPAWARIRKKTKTTPPPLFSKKKSKISGGGIFVLQVPNKGLRPRL